MNERKKKGTRWLGLVTALLLLGMLTGLAGQARPVSAAIPVAMDDFYATVMEKTLVINEPGVLINDTDTTVGHTLTAVVVTDTTHGTLLLATDGSFTYTPKVGFIGVDTFTYKAFDNVLNESSPATVQITVLDDYGAVWGCTIDEGGPNDEVAQGDLTRMCTDLNPANADYTNIKWNWDVVYGTGGGASIDACALFDLNDNTGIDYAVCVEARPEASMNNLFYHYQTLAYSCSDRTDKPENCWNEEFISVLADSCVIYRDDTDPFPPNNPMYPGDPGGESWPYDTVAECSIDTSWIFDVDDITLVNVCSYPSSSASSDAKDCILDTSEGYSFLNLTKITEPEDTTGVEFDFSITGGDFSRNTTLSHGETDRINVGVPVAPFTITETPPMGWKLIDVSCKDDAGEPTGTPDLDNSKITGVALTLFEETYCTFTNRFQNVDLAVTKSDEDYTKDGAFHYYKIGDTFTYTIEVEYLDTLGTGGIAYDVELVDDLDPFIKYLGPVEIDPLGDRSCQLSGADPVTGGGGTLTCDLDEMAQGDLVTVSFEVEILANAPLDGLIEFGTCEQDPNQQWDPVTETYMPVDICNVVSVSTTSTDIDLTNNTDSEPKDVGVPTAVTVQSFTATGMNGYITLDWENGSGTGIEGFNIYRAPSLNGRRTLLTQAPQTASTYKDQVKQNSTLYYWLEVVFEDGDPYLYEEFASASVLKNNKK